MTPRARRRTTASLLAALLIGGLLPLTAHAEPPADVTVLGESKNELEPLYNESVLGDFTIAGNAWVACGTESRCDHRITTSGGAGIALDNGSVPQHFVGPEADARRTVSRPEFAAQESSAHVAIPPGARVVYALLSWMGDHPFADPADVARVPQIKVGGGGYTYPSGPAHTYWSGNQIFGGSAEVTDAFAGVTGPVVVSTLPGPLTGTGDTGANTAAGWAVTVVYAFDDPAVAEAAGHHQRRVQIQEGFYWVPSNSAGEIFTMSFDAIPVDSGVHVGFIGSEGDRGGGDWFRVVDTDTWLQPPWAAAEGADGTADFAISVAQGAIPLAPLTAAGGFGNHYGFDYVPGDATSLRWFNNFSVDAFDWEPQENIWSVGQNSLRLQAAGNGDGYRLHQLALSTPVAQLEVDTEVEQSTFVADDVLTFRYRVDNPSPIRVYAVDLEVEIGGAGQEPVHESGGDGVYSDGTLSLRPGESAYFTVQYTATAADQTAQRIESRALVRGLLVEGSGDWDGVNAGSQVIEVPVAEPPVITTVALPGATAGEAYSEALAYTGTGPVTFTVQAGSGPPEWLSLSPEGVLSGTPTVADEDPVSFTVVAQNAAGTDARTFSVAVEAGPLASIELRPDTATVLLGESQIYEVLGYDAHGNPRGPVAGAALTSDVAEDSVVGLTVTPADVGERTITASAAGAPDATATLTAHVVPVITPGDPPRLSIDAPFTHDVVATGYPTPSFEVSAGVLPDGLALDPVTGRISGTPTTVGVSTVTITARNAAGADDTDITFVVDPAPAVLAAERTSPGDVLTVSGLGYWPGETVELVLHSDPIVLGTAVVTGMGTFSTLVPIPADAAVGAHALVVTGLDSGRVGTAALLLVAGEEAGPGRGAGPGLNTGGSGGGGAGSEGAAGSEVGAGPGAGAEDEVGRTGPSLDLARTGADPLVLVLTCVLALALGVIAATYRARARAH